MALDTKLSAQDLSASTRRCHARRRIDHLESILSRPDMIDLAGRRRVNLAASDFMSAQTIMRLSAARFDGLMDPTGLVIENGRAAFKTVQRSTLERQVLDDFWQLTCANRRVPAEAVKCFSHAYRARAGVCDIRHGDVGLADADGNVVATFPPKARADGYMDQLNAIFRTPGPPILRAALCLFTIVHYHPFSDGNGRMARTFFNFMLRHDGLPGDQYVPLFELMYRARGGYEIALRRAEVAGDWAPFMTFMMSAVAVANCR